MNEVELMVLLEEPVLDPILTVSDANPELAVSDYVVEPIWTENIDPLYFSDQINIIDFGKPYGPSNPSVDLNSNTSGMGCVE